MSSDRAVLNAVPRTNFGSRTTRRLRREGKLPGVVYSEGTEAMSFQVESRDARVVLSAGHALFDLQIEGSKPVPVVVKEQQHHPVRGDLQHLDLQKVRLDVAILAEVAVELAGSEDSPGVKQGGVLEHVTREVTVRALPAAIPDSIVLEVSDLEINDNRTLEDLVAPEGVELVADDPAEITIVTLSPPRVEEEPELEIEEEPGVVGEEAEGDGAEAPAEEGSGEESSDEG
ncbi:MAG: 50S ribosomal protein L25 [Solirubrobacterales bacterium]